MHDARLSRGTCTHSLDVRALVIASCTQSTRRRRARRVDSMAAELNWPMTSDISIVTRTTETHSPTKVRLSLSYDYRYYLLRTIGRLYRYCDKLHHQPHRLRPLTGCSRARSVRPLPARYPHTPRDSERHLKGNRIRSLLALCCRLCCSFVINSRRLGRTERECLSICLCVQYRPVSSPRPTATTVPLVCYYLYNRPQDAMRHLHRWPICVSMRLVYQHIPPQPQPQPHSFGNHAAAPSGGPRANLRA